MTTSTKEPSIDLLNWADLNEQHKLSSAFKRKSSWVIHAPSTPPLWYATVLSNLTCHYVHSEPVNIALIRNVLHAGLGRDAFDRLKLVAGLTAEELGRTISVPMRTLARRDVFKPDESERLLRVAGCFQKSLDVLGDLQKARRWFSSPKRALGDRTPLELCDTGPGAESVEHLLGRIEHGVFT
jgi:putative toxin-antitoxin system antitoxin component (TIGR02293 family)